MLSSILTAGGIDEQDDQEDYKNVIAEVYTEEDDLSAENSKIKPDSKYTNKRKQERAKNNSTNRFEFNHGIRDENDTYDDETSSFAS